MCFVIEFRSTMRPQGGEQKKQNTEQRGLRLYPSTPPGT